MSRAFRTALTWLLLLALPLQGYAASRMMHCAPSHHGQRAAMLASAPAMHGAPAAHHHADGTLHQHAAPDAAAGGAAMPDAGAAAWHATMAADHAQGHAAAPQHAVDSGVSAATADSPTPPGTCSACAACCNAAALVSSPWQPPFADSSPSYRVAPLAGYTGFTPAGLERPPRTVLA